MNNQWIREKVCEAEGSLKSLLADEVCLKSIETTAFAMIERSVFNVA